MYSQSPLDNRQTLNNILQTFAQVMAVPQPNMLVDDQINFDVQIVTSVICLHGSDLLDSVGEAHGEVE